MAVNRTPNRAINRGDNPIARGERAAPQLAEAWVRTLRGIRDPQLQIGWVRKQLELLGAARATDVLTIVLARVEQREERYAELLLRVSLSLAAPELAGIKRAIAWFAQARGQSALAHFMGAEIAHDCEHEPSGEPVVETDARVLSRHKPTEQGRPLTLGERKSLARKRDRELLARVLRDPHPDVVRILLDNPALTELDVVRLCARRPIQPQALEQVFRHPRWIVRYRIRRTLALNPYTPEAIALQLLPHLTPADLRAVARSFELPARVRAACSTPRRSLH